MLKRLVRRCACGRDWCALTLTTVPVLYCDLTRSFAFMVLLSTVYHET